MKKCLLVGFYYDDNHMRDMQIKNRKGVTITEVWTELQNLFAVPGVSQIKHVLDNKN